MLLETCPDAYNTPNLLLLKANEVRVKFISDIETCSPEVMKQHRLYKKIKQARKLVKDKTALTAASVLNLNLLQARTKDK